MNRSDIRNNVPSFYKNNATEIHGPIGQRDVIIGQGQVLPAPILPDKLSGSSGSNKVLFNDDSHRHKSHLDSGRLSRPRLTSDKQRHNFVADVKRTSKRSSTRSVQYIQRMVTDKMTLDRKKDLKNSQDRHSFNVSASDALPLNRHVPDTRPEA